MTSQIKDELEEEYERFADQDVWETTGIIDEGKTRYFLAWLSSTKGVDEVIEVMRRLCSSLKCFFQAASEVQSSGESRMGRMEAWLEARICIGTRGIASGCFTLRLDPGGMQGNTVTTSIISPDGSEVGACVFEL